MRSEGIGLLWHKHPAVSIHPDKLMGWGGGGQRESLSNYPIILSVILLSYYPICFRGLDWINLPFWGVHWESLSYYPIHFGESDRINFPFTRGRGLQMESLSYYPIAFRRGSDRLSSLFGRFKGKICPIILLSYPFSGV